MKAQLIVPHSFTPSNAAHVKQRLEAALNHPVEILMQYDDALIGGFVALADGKVFDASIRTQLNGMAKKIQSIDTGNWGAAGPIKE